MNNNRLHLLRPTIFVTLSLGFAALASCDPIPPLHLRYDQEVETELPIVEVNIDVMWQYDLAYAFGYDTTYDWRREWKYGWDEQDEALFGPIGYTKPSSFNIRRYFLGNDTLQKHTSVLRDHVDGFKYRTKYDYGYYDFLVWNDPTSSDGVISLIIDEETTLDSVIVTTNSTNYASRYHAPSKLYAYNQPDELFSAEKENIFISRNYEDYDYFDEENRVYYKYLDLSLYPVTYIYLTQLIIHNNYDRVVNTEGEANISNFAYSACLNSGISGIDPISVHYNNRYKKNIELEDTHEQVDIVGGKLLTFGICGINPFRYANPTQMPQSARTGKHYMDVRLQFGNGFDSTMVFDVTDQVLQRYRGGVLTVEIDMDTIPIPSRSGGTGFDAVVEDWVEETHEFETSNTNHNN